MIQTTVKLTKLTAAEGMTLTNGKTYGKTVYLGKNDRSEAWQEIPDDQVPAEEAGAV